jgi:hypothetical protein
MNTDVFSISLKQVKCPTITTHGKYGYWGKLTDECAKRIVADGEYNNYISYLCDNNSWRKSYYIMYKSKIPFKSGKSETQINVDELGFYLFNNSNRNDPYTTRRVEDYCQAINSLACKMKLNNALKYNCRLLEQYKYDNKIKFIGDTYTKNCDLIENYWTNYMNNIIIPYQKSEKERQIQYNKNYVEDYNLMDPRSSTYVFKDKKEYMNKDAYSSKSVIGSGGVHGARHYSNT